MKKKLLITTLLLFGCTEDTARTASLQDSDKTVTLEHVREREAKINGISSKYLKALELAESSGRDHVVSNKNAKGRMQLKEHAIKVTGTKDPHDPIQAIKGAARYLYLGKQELAKHGYKNGYFTLSKWYNCGMPNLKKNPRCGETHAIKVRNIMRRL